VARLSLRVSPGSTKTAVVGRYGDGWKLRVAAPAESGQANDAVVRLLADVLSLSVQRVEIVSGQTSRNKVVEIDGLTEEAVQAALARASGVVR